jgi:hypothetical protein
VPVEDPEALRLRRRANERRWYAKLRETDPERFAKLRKEKTERDRKHRSRLTEEERAAVRVRDRERKRRERARVQEIVVHGLGFEELFQRAAVAHDQAGRKTLRIVLQDEIRRGRVEPTPPRMSYGCRGRRTESYCSTISAAAVRIAPQSLLACRGRLERDEFMRNRGVRVPVLRRPPTRKPSGFDDRRRCRSLTISLVRSKAAPDRTSARL